MSRNRQDVELAVGQYHVNARTLRPVWLLSFRFAYPEEVVFWHVEELDTGKRYDLDQHRVGRELNEMEVLAWASEDSDR